MVSISRQLPPSCKAKLPIPSHPPHDYYDDYYHYDDYIYYVDDYDVYYDCVYYDCDYCMMIIMMVIVILIVMIICLRLGMLTS